jgi:hypothetical protein
MSSWDSVWGGKAWIHENSPSQVRKQMKEVGWANGMELVKLARRDRQN